MAVTQLTNYNPDGTSFGQDSSDLIAFYNATPVVRPTGPSAVTTATITTAATSTTPWGFATSTQADAVLSRLAALTTLANALRTNMNTLGLQSTVA